MEKTKRYLQIMFWIPIIIAATIAILYETDILIPGLLVSYHQADFFVTIMMQLAAIGLIPLTLRLFKFAPIAARLQTDKERALKPLGTLRILLMGVPLVADTLFYYLFMNTTFGYLALIILLCMIFIYPTAAKCEYETLDNNSQL